MRIFCPKHAICLFLFILLLFLHFPSQVALAESWGGRRVDSSSFGTEKSLRGYIDFWLLVFSKYGKDHLVFHHRSHPDIIYSVLDFSEFANQYKGKKLKRKKANIEKEEFKNIQKALKHLARKKKPSSELERRIQKLFREAGIDTPRDYRSAAKNSQIRSQTGIKERFSDGVKRSGRYLYAIEEIFEREGLPTQLSRLPLVESSFDYNAYSSVGAAGIWQFMRSTGRRYLVINSSIDERRDPIFASRAAAKYLKHAYRVLEKWPLAVTSYNHGINGVLRATKALGTKDLAVLIRKHESRTFGFASKNFYAEFVAALEVEQQKHYYFPNLSVEPPVYFDEVQLGQNSSYGALVSASGLREEGFRDLNPSLKKPVRAGRVFVPKRFFIKVPRGQGKRFIQKLGHGKMYSFSEAHDAFFDSLKARNKAFRASTSRYRVRRGDTIGSLARRFGVSKRALMELNNISDPRKLYAGRRIRIPGRSLVRADSSSSKKERKSKTYIIKAGDNLSNIAKKYKTSVSRIRSMNPRLGKVIYPGQRIKLP